MISDTEYNNLLNKYNRVVAQNQDLQEQLTQHRDHMEKREQTIKVDLDKVRQLCETILSKDKSEMVVGAEYAWRNVPIRSLIEKAVESYQKYNRERNAILLKIADLAEDRLRQIENLTDQISQMEIMAKERGSFVSAEEAKEVVETQKAEKETLEQANTNVREAIQAGNCDFIVSEDDDVTPIAMAPVTDALKINASKRITQNSIPTSDSRKKVETVKKEKERVESISKAHIINLGDYASKFTETMTVLYEIIGSTGESEIQKLEELTLTKCKEKNITCTSSRLRGNIQQLISMQLLEKESFGTPLNPKKVVVRLSVTDVILYKELYKKSPEQSEWDKIVSEHSNGTHGYGILEMANVMKESKNYVDVCCFNHRNPIPFKDGTSFVPDIIAKTNRYTEYIEYERGTTLQPDFVAKMNKFAMVTKFLNIIVPNEDVASNVFSKIRAWIETRGGESLKGVTIRVTTARYFNNNDPGSKKSWQYTLNPATGEIKEAGK